MAKFEGQRYIALETFKRNGEGVKTTVWFIEDEGKLYVWTPAISGKAKRIQANSKVRVTPSSGSGKPKGDWVEAKARILNSSKFSQYRDLIRKKYGFQFWIANWLHGNRIIIEIDPVQ